METGKTSEPTYQDYLQAGFVPLFCKGNHPEYNQRKDYEKAKQPALKGWNSSEYVPPTLEEIAAWEKAGGWTGWKPPRGVIVTDVDKGPDDIARVREICRAKGIQPGIHRTNNGLHFFFRTNHDLKGDSEVFTKCGMDITYRVWNNQIVLAPTNGRTWENWVGPEDSPMLPDELLPYDRKNPDDILNCFAWAAKKAYQEGSLSGYENIDLALIAFLIECRLSDEQIHSATQLIFLSAYDERRTSHMIDRTREKRQAGDPIIGAGSFIQKVKELDLKEVGRFARELQNLSANRKEPEQDQSGSMVFTHLDDLLGEPEEKASWVVEGLLPSAGLGLIGAKPKAGKSTITRQLAHCVAQGLDFLGRKVLQGPVLYCAFEEKRGEVRKHYRLMGTKGPIHNFINVAPPDAMKGLELTITEKRPVLVIIDTLLKLCRVTDGNSYTEIIGAIEPLLRLARDTGACVFSVHHTGKGDRQGGDSILGSTGIFASVDTVLILKRNEKYRTIQSIQRYGEDMEETTLKWDPERKMVSLGKSRQDEDVEAMEETLLQFLQSQEEPLTEGAIDEAVEGRKALKVKALRSLVDKEKLDRIGKGGKGDPFRYSCSLVPTIYMGTTKQENKNDGKPNNGADYSCSGVFSEERNSREQESEDLPDVEVIA